MNTDSFGGQSPPHKNAKLSKGEGRQHLFFHCNRVDWLEERNPTITNTGNDCGKILMARKWMLGFATLYPTYGLKEEDQ